MARTILSVVGSLLLLNLIAVGILAGAWTVLGAEGVFRPGSWETTGGWVAVMLGATVVASVIAGAACRVLAAQANAPIHLVIIVLLTGLLSAANPRPPAPAGAADRPADVRMMEAMNAARPPSWFLWTNALIGPVGVLIGGTLLSARSDQAPDHSGSGR
jgi:hypothetical protein